MVESFETGGEVLVIGSTVIAFNGITHKPARVVRIGTARIILNVFGSDIAFSKETRANCNGVRDMYFRTRTEIAVQRARALLEVELRDLGVEAVRRDGVKDLRRYPDRAIRELIAVLQKYPAQRKGEG